MLPSKAYQIIITSFHGHSERVGFYFGVLSQLEEAKRLMTRVGSQRLTAVKSLPVIFPAPPHKESGVKGALWPDVDIQAGLNLVQAAVLLPSWMQVNHNRQIRTPVFNNSPCLAAVHFVWIPCRSCCTVPVYVGNLHWLHNTDCNMCLTILSTITAAEHAKICV